MGDAEPTVYFGFPPLASVIGLEGAPSAVIELLLGRWMAQTVDPDPAQAPFVLGWRRPAETAPAAASEPVVRWRADAEGGWLWNGCGRVVLSPAERHATVELAPGALERAACLEPLLEAALGNALAARGECFLHAAAFEWGGRRLLAIGDGGAGKSTLTAAVAAHGGRVISDDSLLLGLSEGRPVVRAARRDLWLRPGSEALLPALAERGLAARPAADGRLRIGRGRRRGSFGTSTEPDRLVLLERDRDAPGVRGRALSQAEALAALLQGTSALYVTEGRFAEQRSRLLALMTAFAEQLPATRLSLGSSLLESTEECLAAIVASLP